MVLFSQEHFKVGKQVIKLSLQLSEEVEGYNQVNERLEYHGHQCFHLYSAFHVGGDYKKLNVISYRHQFQEKMQRAGFVLCWDFSRRMKG